ncbi:LexA family transcriptional regulator [Rhodovulum sp. DZ06]|uniref:LexA family transcriptional regulator n=1 Tax=Rhodovulum sp. DZ06 TaxID=3425126 RepID=UPI003D33D4A1
MTPAERLREIRTNAGFATAAEAARKFGWSPVTYRAHESGQNGMRPNVAKVYARAFRVSPEWLLYGEGGPEKKGVPLVGEVGAGAIVFPLDDGGSLDEIDPPPGIGPSAVAVRVTGDSMYPRYDEGDVLVYDRHALPDELVNQECVVRLLDGRTYVKILRSAASGTYSLESHNAPPIRDVQIEWAAPILWVKRARG